MTDQEKVDEFIRLYEQGAHGCEMDYKAAQFIAIQMKALTQRLATVEGALKDAIEALDYYKLHRVAGMEVLLYESRNEHCPQLTMEAIKKHLQHALAPAPGGQEENNGR